MPINPRTRTTDATTEPVNIAELRDHLRLDHTDEDATLYRLIRAARQTCEDYCERAFVTQTWKLYLDTWPTEIECPRPPLIAVSSIAYVDTDGDSQTLSSATYTVDTDSEPGRIYLAYNQSWPSIRSQDKAITVTYTAGYGTTGQSVPEPIRHAILLTAADLYELREGTLVGTTSTPLPHANRLLDPYAIPEAL